MPSKKESADSKGSGHMWDVSLVGDVSRLLSDLKDKTSDNLAWLQANMPPYFFISMRREAPAVMNLVNSLHQVPEQTKVNLIDEPKKLIMARRDIPGSLYETLQGLGHRAISYAEVTHSNESMPGSDRGLEVQKFEFDLKSPSDIAAMGEVEPPPGLEEMVSGAMKEIYPDFDFSRLRDRLGLLWANSPDYVQASPPERIARLLWLYQQGIEHEGLYLNAEQTKEGPKPHETRLQFAVGNPPKSGFMAQIMEVFNRLNIGVRRLYGLNISTQYHNYFLGNFYVVRHDRKPLTPKTQGYKILQSELYNTQILSTDSHAYKSFVVERIQTGEDASLTNTLILFCHTTLAHNQPDRFDIGEVRSAFLSHPEMTMMLIDLFRVRFKPGINGRQAKYDKALAKAEKAIAEFNTGHRRLDEVRREIYRTCLLFIRYTLKTNFFVPEKHALAFRLDPAYLAELGSEYTGDLPQAMPFRVTFFFGRHGVGYHIGFSDIARGGWRTIICRSDDQFTTSTNHLFREVFVLAHTQHLKNKDIYEGGSKLAVAMGAVGLEDEDSITQRMYKLQYGFINAFFDIFVTKNGKAVNPMVVDYYGEDEPIEIGPDENMHDAMIELIAKRAVKRNYVLGIGIMSSKDIGINHKEYGVTSRGVIKSASVAMREAGIDIYKDPFTVKITGGPWGDVAGNSMALLLDQSPKAAIITITDGSGAMYDPKGADKKALKRLLMKEDIDKYDPKALSPGGFILYRQQTKSEALRLLYKKVVCTKSGLKEEWVTSDDFQKELGRLLFDVDSDLFLPCGGRPETIDKSNWHRLFDAKGKPSCRVIVEGANSFITPEARQNIQAKGVILIRDASANKCGVISSSYEIIANLLMTEKEFLAHKDAYVKDVLAILDKRAADEAELIFKRHKEAQGSLLFTQISSDISTEINDHYAKLFEFFKGRQKLIEQPIFHKVLLSHLPALIQNDAKYRARIKDLPEKIKCAILASEIASFIVYHGGWDTDLEGRLKGYLKPYFG